jgi:hypothetical protein
VGSLLRHSVAPTRVATWTSQAPPTACAIRRSGTPLSMPSLTPTGLSTRNRPSVGRPRCCGTWGATLTGSRSATTACSPSKVTFRWKDYAHGHQWRTMTLTAMEFLRRFVQHILPRGFVRIRQFGFLASASRTARLALARRLLRRAPPPVETSLTTPAWHCPRCGAPMVVGPNLSTRQLGTRIVSFDTS